MSHVSFSMQVGRVAQLLTRSPLVREVGGSIPQHGKGFFIYYNKISFIILGCHRRTIMKIPR